MKFSVSLPTFLLLATLSFSQSGSAGEVLSVPASDRAQQITVAWPGQVLDQSKPWRLVERPGGSSVPADIEASRTADGLPTKVGQVLLATISPSTNSSQARRFELLSAEGQGGTEAVFRFAELNDKSLGVWEGKRLVFVYNFGVLSKAGVPADRNRSTYLHPIYGLDGEVLTDDFPQDHLHHRGLFWAWPHVRMGNSNYDLWDLRGIQQRFEHWLERQTGKAAAVLGIENGWYIGDNKVMQERAWFTLFPASVDGQALDVELAWVPTTQPLSLAGAEGKSYGGFTLRFAPRTETVITTPLGSQPDDLAVTRLAWADLSALFQGAAKASGAAIFIGPDHPDYPPTWLTRHYGALCVGWPGVTAATFEPGQIIHCRYRVWLHRGRPSQADLAKQYQVYQSIGQAHWESAAK